MCLLPLKALIRDGNYMFNDVSPARLEYVHLLVVS